jgi:pimeloyl-ACP methyl ester carboxylesterase
MSTIEQTQTVPLRDPVVDKPRRGPVVRVILGSLFTGLAIAVALPLVVVPGAPENVTTGSVLLAFAAGWAMLAVLSARMTTVPQRWAFVPSAAMAVTGAALLTFIRDNQAVTAASWVWPPALIALVGWMTIRVRRDLPGRAKWLLYPVIGVLAVAAVGGMAQSFAQRVDQHHFAMPGRLYDVGGQRLHLNCIGTGSPTVVLENGLGESSPQWTRIADATAATTRVCAYDRAGQGWSDDASGPQDGVTIAKDLHTLLHVAGEHGPYVLVGHSTGGVYAMTFAAQYPQQVAALVLVDSASPDQFTVLPDYKSQYAMMRRLYGVAPSMARIGIARVVSSMTHSTLPGRAADEAAAFASSPRAWQTDHDELTGLRAAFRQAKALVSLGDRPVVIVSAADTMRTTRGWTTAQDQFTHLSSNTGHRIVNSTHDGVLVDEPAGTDTARAITDAVYAVRTSTPVRAS